MSRQERTGQRPSAYSRWHRALPDLGVKGRPDYRQLAMIDADWIEYCDRCLEPVGLVEEAEGIDQAKNGTETGKLAEKAGIPGFVVLTDLDAQGAIRMFRVRRLWPKPTRFYDVSPDKWHHSLLALRTCHPWPDSAPVSHLVDTGRPQPEQETELLDRLMDVAWAKSHGMEP